MAAVFRAGTAGHCRFRDASDETALLALQGPRALEVLSAAGAELDVASELPGFRFRDAKVAGVACTIARTGYTGEDGVELFVAERGRRPLFRALMEAGRSFGIEPVGLGARDTLRLEARLALYGNDIDETTNPIEAGLGWTVKLDKPAFVGREAIARVKAAGPVAKARRLRDARPRHRPARLPAARLERHDASASARRARRRRRSARTSGSATCRPCCPPSAPTIAVDCRGKSIEAVVVATPFYKRSRAA